MPLVAGFLLGGGLGHGWRLRNFCARKFCALLCCVAAHATNMGLDGAHAIALKQDSGAAKNRCRASRHG